MARAKVKENAQNPPRIREKENQKEKARKASHQNVPDQLVRILVLAKERAKLALIQLTFVAMSKAIDMYQRRPELTLEADLHQVKLTVRLA